ncbi:YraN family protein [Schnuerera sp. xch1]|uniref:YraN family protein n=1 Tax=Schnuerera sp. xch1 TaxID=2874283 RepID=UPI001CC09ABB|nr:YraN family protein [Schnuerera sp. xch1]MBZ2173889.1 YraN family protein [Schnuerera sp. xch1]
MSNNIQKGAYGEGKATKYLISKGYKIIDRNYTTRIGEIDIIAIKSKTLVFVEVKTRSNTNYGFPYEAVNRKKQNKILRSSLIYIKHKKLDNYQARYDIIEVYLHDEPNINHIENAFCM